MKTNRIYFIDAVRAFAILMMLQGHFIDSLLAIEFRDRALLPYRIWEYFRGITAPTFFTISGLIFTFLLLKAKENQTETVRIKKGFKRGLMLIGIGYLLRLPVFKWLNGDYDKYYLVVDVLQIIGLSLIGIVLLYILSFRRVVVFATLTIIIGVGIFITEPMYRNLVLENIPIVFSNYLSKANGSIFTFIPWFGYMCFGAFIANIFYTFYFKKFFKTYTVIWLVALGMVLMFSSPLFLKFSKLTDVILLKDVSNYNYLFERLGNVFIIFAIFYTFENYIKHPIILKIGRKTLSIYIIHFIILYGTFTGLGLYQLIGKNLVPWQAVTGAALFLVLVSFIAINYVKANDFINYKLKRKKVE